MFFAVVIKFNKSPSLTIFFRLVAFGKIGKFCRCILTTISILIHSVIKAALTIFNFKQNFEKLLAH